MNAGSRAEKDQATGLSISGRNLARLLETHRFNVRSESELHAALKQCFSGYRFPFSTEEQLGPGARVDFFFDPGLAVEVKILGATNEVLRQLGRYAESERVREIALITTRKRLAAAMPPSICGKPVTAICLERNLFG